MLKYKKGGKVMIDIHTHILPFVDDGSGRIEDSLKMLEAEISAGVTDVFLTPHLRDGFTTSESELKKAFAEFLETVKKRGLNVKLYLGQEIFLPSDKPQLNGVQQIVPLNGTKYVLIEFDFLQYVDMVDTVYEIVRLGYTPIVCHFERYFYADFETAYNIKETGGMIQLNADSVMGDNKSVKKFARKLLKYGLVDFIASDIHVGRINRMAEAKAYVEKKFCTEYAEDLFCLNAEKIINKDLT